MGCGGGGMRYMAPASLLVGEIGTGAEDVEVGAEVARPPLEHDASFRNRENELVALLQVELPAQTARQHDLTALADLDHFDQRFTDHARSSIADPRVCNTTILY